MVPGLGLKHRFSARMAFKNRSGEEREKKPSEQPVHKKFQARREQVNHKNVETFFSSLCFGSESRSLNDEGCSCQLGHVSIQMSSFGNENFFSKFLCWPMEFNMTPWAKNFLALSLFNNFQIVIKQCWGFLPGYFLVKQRLVRWGEKEETSVSNSPRIIQYLEH